MKYFWLLGFFLIAIVGLGALPSGSQAVLSRAAYLPLVIKEPSPTPTVTPTPSPTPSVPHYQYRAFVQNQGWQDWKDETQDAGTTGQALNIEEGALYPALHRLEARGWVESEWGLTEQNRRAKYYRLTRAGREQCRREASAWERYAGVMARVIAAGRA